MSVGQPSWVGEYSAGRGQAKLAGPWLKGRQTCLDENVKSSKTFLRLAQCWKKLNPI